MVDFCILSSLFHFGRWNPGFLHSKEHSVNLVFLYASHFCQFESIPAALAAFYLWCFCCSHSRWDYRYARSPLASRPGIRHNWPVSFKISHMQMRFVFMFLSVVCCISYLSHWYDQIPGKSSVERGLFWFTVWGCGPSWQLEHDTPCHTAATDRKPEAMSTDA